MLPYCLACFFSPSGKLAVILVFVPLFILPLAISKIFSLSLILNNLIMMFFDVVFFIGVDWTYWICEFIVFIKFGEFLAIISSNTLFCSAFLLFSLKLIFGQVSKFAGGWRKHMQFFIVGVGTQGIPIRAAVAEEPSGGALQRHYFPRWLPSPLAADSWVSPQSQCLPLRPQVSSDSLEAYVWAPFFLTLVEVVGALVIYFQEKKQVDWLHHHCHPCAATAPLRYTRLNWGSSLTWGTPRWYMPGRVATSSSECLAGVKTRSDDLTRIFRSLRPGARKAEWAAASLCCLYASSAPCWILGVPSSSHPFPAGSQAASLTLLPPYHLSPL